MNVPPPAAIVVVAAHAPADVGGSSGASGFVPLLALGAVVDPVAVAVGAMPIGLVRIGHHVEIAILRGVDQAVAVGVEERCHVGRR